MDFSIWLLVGISASVVIGLVLMYNSLVGKKNQVENVLSSVDVVLKKRHDLIPNLIASVKNYMSHESDLLSKVTELRTQAQQEPLESQSRMDAEKQLSGALGKLVISAEQYPDLKASENFLQLQRALNEVEEQLSGARRAFNSSVTKYNNSVEMFPSNLIASMFGFQYKEWYELPDQSQREVVDVESQFAR
jgi:LemA protein